LFFITVMKISESWESRGVFTPWVEGQAAVNESKLPPIGVVFAQAVPDDEIAARLVGENARLVGKNARLVGKNARLVGENARLVDENAILRGQSCGRYEDSLKPTPPTLPPVKGATGVRRNRLAEQRMHEEGEEDAIAEEKWSREGARKCAEDKNPYRFKGDEGCWYRHSKRGRYRVYPVSRERDFGARGSVDDGDCCGAVQWEGANKSSALIATGLPKKHFRIRCTNYAVQGSFCDKCVRKQNANFFTDKLRVRSEYNGMTHYQFMKENLEY
jgi:hypothetical protein